MKLFFHPEPITFANHGGIPELPGDTLLSFSRAVELDTDVISVNVRVTKDRRIIVISEENLEDISNISGKVSQYTLKELKKLDAAFQFTGKNGDDYPYRDTGIRFLSLEELLEEFPGQRFNIKLMDKCKELTLSYFETINRTNSQNRVLSASVHGIVLNLVRAKFPGMATSFSFPGVLGFYLLFRTGFLFFKKRFKADALQIPEVIGTSYMANQGLIRDAKERNLRVHIRDVNNEEQIKRLYNGGAHGFMTDNIIQLKQVLSSIKRS